MFVELHQSILVVLVLTMCAFSGTEGSTIRSSRISDFGTLEQTLGFRIEDAVDIGRSMQLISWCLSDVDWNTSKFFIFYFVFCFYMDVSSSYWFHKYFLTFSLILRFICPILSRMIVHFVPYLLIFPRLTFILSFTVHTQ